MTELTDFQQVVAMALDISDEQASLLKKSWPESERELRTLLRQWRMTTGSTVSGHELLAICREVWRQRPVGDIALTEGRTVLYHPQTGQPIEAGSALDGIPVETLAFLNWSIVSGWLSWADEIAIAREVKGATTIEDLPPDRFYAKNMLPRLPDGSIDWSDLGLAEAKAFVTSGARPSTQNILTKAIHFDDRTLEGVLSSIPALSDQGARNHLLSGLPSGPVGAIPRNTAPSTDIANIVSAVRGFGRLANGKMAINVLISNALRYVRGTSLETKLKGFSTAYRLSQF